MTKIATFANGQTDVYKGNRDVTAAWAVVRKSDGAVIKSGHSLDRAKAAKTAEGKLQEVFFDRDFDLHQHPLQFFRDTGQWQRTAVRRAAKAHNAERLAFIRSLVDIEIVDL